MNGITSLAMNMHTNHNIFARKILQSYDVGYMNKDKF